MSYTKRQFVDAAFEEIGLASYVFDLTTEELASALRRLDAMMAQWNAKGIRLGYPLPTLAANSSLFSNSEVPDAANEAIILNLGHTPCARLRQVGIAGHEDLSQGRVHYAAGLDNGPNTREAVPTHPTNWRRAEILAIQSRPVHANTC
jgi:hypothetical protein